MRKCEGSRGSTVAAAAGAGVGIEDSSSVSSSGVGDEVEVGVGGIGGSMGASSKRCFSFSATMVLSSGKASLRERRGRQASFWRRRGKGIS